ncbi:protein ACCELERATED CELL DEATH 6-like [Castanea sativa]|uniref:protein ACCELERATED CELL DEATH 6-like n=1 Tax=Castanea sativa TaxID=21020 RepID=UPI003F64F9A0
MNLQVFKAASSGDLSFFENLAGSDPNSSTLLQVTIEKNTVLHVALQFKKFEAAKTIVNLRPSLVYETNSKSNTPLHVVARVGDSSMVKLLIDQAKKLDVETGGRQQLLSMVNQDEDTALHVAVRYGNFDVVEELINENDPAKLAMQVNKAGESALFLAVDKPDYNIASHILRNAPECSYAGRRGMNVLHALVIHTSSYINTAATGVMESFKENIIKELEIFASFFKGTWDAMDFHKRARAPTPGGGRPTPGGLYTRIIGTDFFREVMEKCPSTIEQQDDLGWTPLHMAAHMGNKELVKLLLKNDNSIAYLKNKASLSALHIAAEKGNVSVMKKLTTACPDIYELLNERDQSALHVAAESGERAAVEFFLKRLEFNGLINEQDKEGNTPMHLAAINGHYEIVFQMASCRGVNAKIMNIDGSTIMDIVPSGKLDFQLKGALWREGARPGLMELLKREEKADNSMPKSSDTLKEAEFVVATLIATVTFAAAFTVPGGLKSQGVDEGSAVLSKTNAFQIFLIANSATFGLSLASVFSHFSASAMILDIIHRQKIVPRALDSTSFSTFAMLLAFIVGTYTVVPHSMGITIAAIVCLCFFGNYIYSLLHILKSSLSLLVSGPTQKKNKHEVTKNGSTTRSDSETRTTTATAAEATETTLR